MGSIYIGLLFIVLGVLIRFFPNLLAGFNQLSQKERENAIENGLPTFASVVIGSMGLISIAGYFAAIWFDIPSLSNLGILAIIVGLIILVVFGNLLANKRTR